MNQLGDILRSSRWRAPAVIALGAWLVIEVLLVGVTMHLGWFDLPGAIKVTLPMSLVWLVFAPLSVWLGFRFPIERGQLAASLGAHLTACLVLIIASRWALQTFSRAPAERSTSGAHPLDQEQTKGRGSAIQTGRTANSRQRGAPLMAQMALDVLFYAVIVSSCQAVAWSQRAQERERRALTAEARLAEARLAVLQMRLNPHFLFNALNGISALIPVDAGAADRMLGDLSGLLRPPLIPRANRKSHCVANSISSTGISRSKKRALENACVLTNPSMRLHSTGMCPHSFCNLWWKTRLNMASNHNATPVWSPSPQSE